MAPISIGGRSLNEAGVRKFFKIRNLLDDADLKQ
jgi:hypothetical protein